MFQEEGILNLILDAIDKMNVITGQGILSSLAGEESGQQWNDVSAYLFQLLGKGSFINDVTQVGSRGADTFVTLYMSS